MSLYRKYRPASFGEIVGQDQVTIPLSNALDSGRINHAYLFSGPRGTGKTSSARILVRSLNCEQGPTSTPCGECESCIALAPGGHGTLDVTELDAATHNGVEDMRELRDRAIYAPSDSRYRIFIIDEAHMITAQGFDALLKIVEEPPEHLIFIFATTEPEKVPPTIRSRTHNYPFKLLTPPDMRELLEKVIKEEGVKVDDDVYPLVIRAGGGSPRDSLSIMDQLIEGSGPDGVTYPLAVSLLGVTDSSLLDRAIDALGSGDQSDLFGVVDDVINNGYDPRRFTIDLLDRLRDLLILKAVPDAFNQGLVDVPESQQDTLRAEADSLTQSELTHAASVVNDGLSDMRGATSPRLLLEILMARLTIPSGEQGVAELTSRLDSMERQLSTGAVPVVAQAAASAPSAEAEATEPVAESSAPQVDAEPPADSEETTADPEQSAPEDTPQPEHAVAVQSAVAEPVDSAEEIAQAQDVRTIIQRNRKRKSGESIPAEPFMEQEEQAPEPANTAPVEEPVAEQEQAEQTTSEQVDSADHKEDAPEDTSKSDKEPETSELDTLWATLLPELRSETQELGIAGRQIRLEQGPEDAQYVLRHHTLAFANYLNDHRDILIPLFEKSTGKDSVQLVSALRGVTELDFSYAPSAVQENAPVALDPAITDSDWQQQAAQSLASEQSYDDSIPEDHWASAPEVGDVPPEPEQEAVQANEQEAATEKYNEPDDPDGESGLSKEAIQAGKLIQDTFGAELT